jgi:hypothetical protein
MSSRDIAVLKRTIIHCISSEIGFSILAERPREMRLMFNTGMLRYDDRRRSPAGLPHASATPHRDYRVYWHCLHLHNAGGTTLALLRVTAEKVGHLRADLRR